MATDDPVTVRFDCETGESEVHPQTPEDAAAAADIAAENERMAAELARDPIAELAARVAELEKRLA